jgi:hypothetical protein
MKRDTLMTIAEKIILVRILMTEEINDRRIEMVVKVIVT